ncbi:MAG: hypothetical protein HQ558_05055 [Candidatus Omnitrophica bacterium]|nr:hypothetical protein [Candidatus Omnitrophota bacterium]
MRGYIAVDKKRVVCADDIVAVVAKKVKGNKSRLVLVRGVCGVSTSAKTLAERIEGGKEKDRITKTG